MRAGGDGLLMACLWKAGYAVTDPGFSFYHPELRMFDPISQEGRQLLYAFTEGLSGGCDSSCQVRCLCSCVLDPRVVLGGGGWWGEEGGGGVREDWGGEKSR